MVLITGVAVKFVLVLAVLYCGDYIGTFYEDAQVLRCDTSIVQEFTLHIYMLVK